MTFILLAAVGLDLTAQDFARVRRQPAVVLTGLVAPVIVLPPIAVALTFIFRTPPDVTAGVLLVAACPIGGISNTYSYLARASTALSVTLTGLSCLCAGLTTIPLVGKGLELALARPLGLAAPIPVLVGQLVLVFGLPVGLGIWMRRRSPRLPRATSQRCSDWPSSASASSSCSSSSTTRTHFSAGCRKRSLLRRRLH